MTYTRKNTGVCSSATTVSMENGIIQDIEVKGGCDGNLTGICCLLKGYSAKEAIERLQGLSCERKKTSCPDQIAICLQEAMQQEQSNMTKDI